MSKVSVIILFISFALSVLQGPIVIPMLRKLKIGQTERVEGMETHLKKTGTPTMGGLMILIAFTLPLLFVVPKFPSVIPVLFLTLGFGVIGFLDDWLKVVKHRSDGLYPKQKMLGQFIVTTIFLAYLWIRDPQFLDILLPFTGGGMLSGTAVRIAATVLAYLAIIGTVNGVNFTDGLDGLAASVTSVAAMFLYCCSVYLQGGIEPAAAAMLGALMGFLCHNAYPAAVFMGDTGSLALGGFVAGCAYMMKMPLFIVIFGLVYLVEVVSVMIQVTYFKKTGGKRFFRMAPIHHHFEKGGWSETKIDTVFVIVTILLCVISWAALH